MRVGGREEGSSPLQVSLWVQQAGRALSTCTQPVERWRSPLVDFVLERLGLGSKHQDRCAAGLRSIALASSSVKRGFYEMLCIEDSICEMLRWMIMF